MTVYRDFLYAEAPRRGIDPAIAERGWNTEGGFAEPAARGTFSTGSSWWAAQLHYGGRGPGSLDFSYLGHVAGMGNSFTHKTGWAPGDPLAWRDAMRYALDALKAGGWGPWYGPKAIGITGFMGIDRNHPWRVTPAGEWDYLSHTPAYVFPVQGYPKDKPVNLHWGQLVGIGASDIFGEHHAPILAMVNGAVDAAGYSSLGGNYVSMTGDDGLDYYYAHGDSAPLVAAGQRVRAGTRFFGLGDTGNAAQAGPHLHIGIGYGILEGGGVYGGSGANFDAVGLLRRVLTQGVEIPQEDPEEAMWQSIAAQYETAIHEMGDRLPNELEIERSYLDDFGPAPEMPTGKRTTKAQWKAYAEAMRAWEDKVWANTHARYQGVGALGNQLRAIRTQMLGV